jgi:oligopeptide/dipeptide ABC transporter ATP-binding protein
VPPLLEVRDLTVRYAGGHGPLAALEGCSLDVGEGEAVGLLGESGCGKTTLLLAVLGLLPAAARVVRGSVRLRGRELLGLSEPELRPLRGAEIAIVLQEPALALNPVRRIGPQVAEVLRSHRAGWSRRRCRQEALALLAAVGFTDPGTIERAYSHELSGGQRQRVALAQALACRPALLLADEPTASLDSTTQAELRALLRSLRARFGMAVLMASHDLAGLAALAGRVVVMYAGTPVEEGTPAQVFGNPLHPYTRGLVRALPVLAPGHSRAGRPGITAIPGAPPDPGRLPPGCAFEPRCVDRGPLCTLRAPRATAPDEGRHVRCFVYGG